MALSEYSASMVSTTNNTESNRRIDFEAGAFVFVNLEQMEELNSLPDTIVDPESIHRENLAVEYTKAVEPDHILLHSLRGDLAPKLGN